MAYEYESRDSRWRPKQRSRQFTRRRNIIICVAVLLLCLLAGVFFLMENLPDIPALNQPPQTSQPTQTEPSEPPATPQTVIKLSFGGDLNVTDKTVASGISGGKFDYSGRFTDVAALFAGADAAIMNFEGNLVGAPYGSSSASAPRELMQAMQGMGIDFVQMANSYAVTNGLSGLSQTLSAIRSEGMEPVGAFADSAEAQQLQGFTLRNIGGLKVAFVAFTKGVGSLGLPAGSESCVNLLYKDYTSTYQKVNTEGITAVLQAVQAQKPDVTIALVHWGSEYNSSISKTQEAIRDLMLENQVDAIIGTHPHCVQKVSFDEAAGQLVAYSLGDFYGDAEKDGSQFSIVLELEFTRDNYTGKTRISGWNYVPVYTLTPERDGEPMRVVRIREAIAMYENNHVSRVSKEAYENMKSALSRIETRLES